MRTRCKNVETWSTFVKDKNECVVAQVFFDSVSNDPFHLLMIDQATLTGLGQTICFCVERGPDTFHWTSYLVLLGDVEWPLDSLQLNSRIASSTTEASTLQ